MRNNKIVYLAWQAPDTKDWHVVGSLTEDVEGYVFRYTMGANKSEKFIPFSGMERLDRTYVSKELFPLFKNRVLSPKRPEYPHFLQWLGLASGELNPIAILERSGGLRGTDKLQVFKRFEIQADGSYDYTFFAHGLGYLAASAQARIASLSKDERLYLCPDVQNDHDDQAIIIRAESPAEIVGYCPRYLAKSFLKLLKLGEPGMKVQVETLSDQAPANYRLLCKASGVVDVAYVDDLMDDVEFQPICY